MWAVPTYSTHSVVYIRGAAGASRRERLRVCVRVESCLPNSGRRVAISLHMSGQQKRRSEPAARYPSTPHPLPGHRWESSASEHRVLYIDRQARCTLMTTARV